MHVAIGVIKDNRQRILIAQRPPHVPQGGLWEFPGGKLEVGETPQQALVRELYEELGIEVLELSLLMEFNDHYGDQSLRFMVWWVDKFEGMPQGCEGQPIRWVTLAALADYPVPAASDRIIDEIRAIML